MDGEVVESFLVSSTHDRAQCELILFGASSFEFM